MQAAVTFSMFIRKPRAMGTGQFGTLAGAAACEQAEMWKLYHLQGQSCARIASLRPKLHAAVCSPLSVQKIILEKMLSTISIFPRPWEAKVWYQICLKEGKRGTARFYKIRAEIHPGIALIKVFIF